MPSTTLSKIIFWVTVIFFSVIVYCLVVQPTIFSGGFLAVQKIFQDDNLEPGCGFSRGRVVIYGLEAANPRKALLDYLSINKLSYEVSGGFTVAFVMEIKVPNGEEEKWMKKINSRFPDIHPVLDSREFDFGKTKEGYEYPRRRILVNAPDKKLYDYLDTNNLSITSSFGDTVVVDVPCGEEEVWRDRVNAALQLPTRAFLEPVVKLY